jgi:hypothetical protein
MHRLPRYALGMVLPATDTELARRLLRYAVIAALAALAVSILSVWFGGLRLLPTVIRNLPYGLLLSVLTTAAAGLITNLAVIVTGRWPSPARWAVYLAGFVVAAVIGTFLTPLIFHLGGQFPRRAVWINFQETIRGTIPVTLAVGSLIMLTHGWHARLKAVEQSVQTRQEKDDRPRRLASRLGGKVEFVDVGHVSHIYAQDKLTYAVTPGRHHPLDQSMFELERVLPQDAWVRIHRKTLANIAFVNGVKTDPFGRLFVRLNDGTELRVARERAAKVRTRLGL